MLEVIFFSLKIDHTKVLHRVNGLGCVVVLNEIIDIMESLLVLLARTS